jgi:hypothetical protein
MICPRVMNLSRVRPETARVRCQKPMRASCLSLTQTSHFQVFLSACQNQMVSPIEVLDKDGLAGAFYSREDS